MCQDAYMGLQIRDLSRVLRALADPTRLRILALLATGEVCVCHVHESLRIPQPKASRHLAYLRRAGLVTTRRQGLWVYYRLADGAEPALDAVRSAATHALGHAEAAGRDVARLRSRTGRVVRVPAKAPAVRCCARRRAGGPRQKAGSRVP